MSKGERFLLERGLEVGQRAIAILDDHVPRVEIAGSIRRGRPDVGDVDIVLEVNPTLNPWINSQIDAILGHLAEQLGLEVTKSGIAYASLRGGPGKVGVDLYLASPETWGITMLIRTGSAQHNVKIATLGRRLVPARMLTMKGIANSLGQVVASKTEEECLRAVGMAWIDPDQREAPEYVVRGEVTT